MTCELYRDKVISFPVLRAIVVDVVALLIVIIEEVNDARKYKQGEFMLTTMIKILLFFCCSKSVSLLVVIFNDLLW